MTLLDIFETHVKRSPTATAVTLEDGKSYSYKDIDVIAQNLGTELACAIAVAPVDEGRDDTPLVAVMMNRGVGLVAAILGILKAGAGTFMLPIFPSYIINLIVMITPWFEISMIVTQRTFQWTHHFPQTGKRTYSRTQNARS